MEKKLEHYKTTSQANVERNASKWEWLDRLTLTRIQESLSVLTARTDSSGEYFKKNRIKRTDDEEKGDNIDDEKAADNNANEMEDAMEQDILSWSESKEERDLRQELYSLVIEFSQYPHPVIYEEELYPIVKPHNPPRDQKLIMSSCVVGYNGEAAEASSQKTTGISDVIEFSTTGKNFSGDAFHVI